MMNYYEELSINSKLNLSDIQKELIRLENLWTRRQVTNPEKATEKLALINQAKKVFASDASRRAYDNELERSKANRETLSPEKIAEQEKQKWQKQAEIYYSEQQYDLAKAAIEKALSSSNTNSYDDTIFALAAEIYRECGHLDLALDYVNKAIVQAPDLSEYYLIKALIFERKAIEASSQYQIQKVNDYYDQVRNQCQIAINKADNSGDASTKAKACGILAFIYYYKNPIDKNKAEQYALMAQRLGGDPWKNAKKVLDEINQIREKEEQEQKRIEEERIRKLYWEAKALSESDNVQILYDAINKYKKINGYSDSLLQINKCQKRIEEINAKEEEQQQKKQKRAQNKKKAIRIICAIAAIGVLITIATTVILNIINIINTSIAEKEHYQTAKTLLEENKELKAAIEFGKAGSYEDAQEQSLLLWKKHIKYKTVSIGSFTLNNHIVALQSDGRVVATGRNSAKQCDVSEWTNIVSIATGMSSTFGVKNDGTVVATGDEFEQQVLNWKNIVTIVAGSRFVAGLRTDGTVMMGSKVHHEYYEEVSEWKDIVSLWCGDEILVGRTIDGKYITAGDSSFDSINNWEDIVEIDEGDSHIVGLKRDGTVYSSSGGILSNWTDIVDISAGIRATVGLKSDGTVMFAGDDKHGESAVREWENIVAIDTDSFQVVGVKANGTALLVGEDAEKSWFKEVSEWDNLMIPQQ